MLNGVLLCKRGVGGIYFIGCGDRIVYIGQSQAVGGITCRSIESLARYYHQINDITLPWSVGLAPVSPIEGEHYTVLLNELESNAIRKFAPIFNTSIPNKNTKKIREPNITHIARVFVNQTEECTAFELNNIEKQSIESKLNTNPPWR
jgi:hypothetical protein